MDCIMRYGSIACKCGQQFHFETAREKVSCIQCGIEHDVSNYPVKEEVEDNLIETLEEGE